MVFQQFYLFPHLTALENVMFGSTGACASASKAGGGALAKRSAGEKSKPGRTCAPLPFRSCQAAKQ